MIVDRRLLPHLDWGTIAALIALMTIGLASIYSARWDFVHHRAGREFWIQLYACGLSLGVFFICLLVDYRTLAQRSLFLYGGLVLLLLYVTFFGVVRNGSRRWIDFGPINLQPSEFARIVMALTLAAYFAGVQRLGQSVKDMAIGAASILAKVERDAAMVAWDRIFPQYGLASHKGYYTPEHLAALAEHGPTSLHRFSFEPVRASSRYRQWTGYPLEHGPEQGELFACP